MMRLGINNFVDKGLWIAISIILLQFSSCGFTNYNKNEVQVGIRFYSDINMFDLVGINELTYSQLRFPYIKIDSVDSNTKEVTFLFDDNTASKRVYRKQALGLWSSERVVEYPGEEGSPFRYYEFIEPTKITVLEYGTSLTRSDIYLSSIEILTGNTITTYDFEPDDFKSLLTNEDSKYPLDEAVMKTVSMFSIHDHILTYQSHRYELPTNKLMGENKSCYIVNNLSYFWWSVIGHKLEKINCVH
jgi:hypothetical protein